MADLSCVLHPMGIADHIDALRVLNAVDVLREAEGSTVTFVSDNPDFNGQPNAKVICNGAWTGWEDREFVAATIIGALRLALADQARCDP